MRYTLGDVQLVNVQIRYAPPLPVVGGQQVTALHLKALFFHENRVEPAQPIFPPHQNNCQIDPKRQMHPIGTLHTLKPGFPTTNLVQPFSLLPLSLSLLAQIRAQSEFWREQRVFKLANVLLY